MAKKRHKQPASLASLESKLDLVLYFLLRLRWQGAKMSVEMDRLEAEVTEIKTVSDSAIVLLKRLAQLIRDNASNPAKLTALANELDAKGNEVAAAITENTPSEEPPPV